MKIALVLASTPAYSETFFNSKIKGLQQQGFTVTLYVHRKTEDFDLCPVVQASGFSGNLLHKFAVAFKTLFNLVLHPKPVLRFIKLERNSKRPFTTILKHVFINSHFFNAKVHWIHFGFAALAVGSENVARAIGAKMAVSFRGFDINVYPLKNENCYHLLWQRVDKVHSISNYLWEKAQTLGLSSDTSKSIITPAIVLKSLPAPAAELKPLKIVTVARFNWIKDLDTAIRALRKLKEQGLQPEYHLVGAGTKEEEEYIRFLVHTFELETQVIFHGKHSHKETLQLVKDASVYLQPSLNEGFCNAVLEAQALGVPCVVTRAGALPENVLEGQTGWLVPLFDNDAMVAALKKALMLSKSDLKQMRMHGIQMVKSNYSIRKQHDQFNKFYTSA